MTFKNLLLFLLISVTANASSDANRQLKAQTILNGSGILTLPTSTDTMVGRATSDTLTNKTLTDSTTLIQDESDNTKKAAFQASSITTGTTRTFTFPNASTTLDGNDNTATLTNKSISGSTNTITNVSLTAGVTGILPSTNGGSGVSNAGSFTWGANNITFTTSGTTSCTLPTSGTLATLAGSEIFTNKTLTDSTTLLQDEADNTKKAAFQLSGITTGTTRTYTLPNASTILDGTDNTATLTNKSISGSTNTITNVSLTSGVTGTLPVGNGGTGLATLTANNVILGNGSSAVSFVAPGTSGNVLTSNGSTWASSAAAAATVTSSGTVKVNSAYITYSGGTPSVTRQDGSWISSITDNGTGDATINITGSTFSVAPNCTVSTEKSGSTEGANISGATTTSAVRVLVFEVSVGLFQDANFYIICVGAQ